MLTCIPQNGHVIACAVLPEVPKVLVGQSAMLLQAVILSISSSTDNFAVGVALGSQRRPLSVRLNAIVALANAVGAFVSAEVGTALGETAPTLAAIFSAAIFVYLGFEEAKSFWEGGESDLMQFASAGVAWKLAIPMTLNNLAGGVAGGLAGSGAETMGVASFAASFLLMLLGHKCGDVASAAFGSLGNSSPNKVRNIDNGSVYSAVVDSTEGSEIKGGTVVKDDETERHRSDDHEAKKDGHESVPNQSQVPGAGGQDEHRGSDQNEVPDDASDAGVDEGAPGEERPSPSHRGVGESDLSSGLSSASRESGNSVKAVIAGGLYRGVDPRLASAIIFFGLGLNQFFGGS